MIVFKHREPADYLQCFRVMVMPGKRIYTPVAAQAALPLIAEGYARGNWEPAKYLLIRTKATGKIARYYPVPTLLDFGKLPPPFAAHAQTVLIQAVEAWLKARGE